MTEFALTEQNGLMRGTETSTFIKNMGLAIHRWFRFPAGFSAEWVKEVIESNKNSQSIVVLDPFAGSGTTLLAGEVCGVTTLGTEAHPFVVKIASSKLLWYKDKSIFRDYCNQLLSIAKGLKKLNHQYPKFIINCYSEEALYQLDTLRTAWEILNDDTDYSKLTWLNITCILRSCSPAGTAPWQYLLPKKTKKKAMEPYTAFKMQMEMMLEDMAFYQDNFKATAKIYNDDARCSNKIQDNSIDLVITSPPYANNYDYADSTRLEMAFWGEIEGWGDLQTTVRKYLVRSCSQHASAEKINLEDVLSQPLLNPIQNEITEICSDLARERLSHGGQKHYHTMIAAYFLDLAKVWISLRKKCKKGAKLCFVIGDSAPYGIYVPVERWLGELALAAGFKRYYFEKIRDRNIKWKNRKRSVPLKEGYLWLEG